MATEPAEVIRGGDAVGLWALAMAASAIVGTHVTIAATLWVFPPPAFDQWWHAMSRSIEVHPVGAWQVAAPGSSSLNGSAGALAAPIVQAGPSLVLISSCPSLKTKAVRGAV